MPLFPSTETQIRTTAEQWDADMGHDTPDRLPGITAPTLVIAGEQDLLTPPWHGRQVAAAIPGATLTIMPGLGHFPMSENWPALKPHLLPVLEGMLSRRPRSAP